MHKSSTAKRTRKHPHVETDGATSHVSKVLRALEILAEGPCTASEITSALRVHPRTVGRLLDSLVSEGYVSQYGTERKRVYSLTLRIMSLGWQVMSRTDLVKIARPYLIKLCAEVNENCHICIPGEDFVVDLIHESGNRLVTVKHNPGAQVPYHCTAIGKAMLAHLPETCQKLLRLALKRYTEHTIVDPAELLIELATIRDQGYAVDNLEFSLDLRCLAAPIFDFNGKVVCALGMSAPAVRFLKSNIPVIAEAVVREASMMSRELGYIDPRQPQSPAGRDTLPSASEATV
jgi:DNA-binding IclR family transcriptional regulator